MPSTTCKCPVCSKNITKTSRSVACDYCEEYFHIACAGMSVEQHGLMLKNKIFKHVCGHCSRQPKYCNIQEQLRNGFLSLVSLMEQKLEEKFSENKRKLDEQLESGLKLFDDKIKELSIPGASENTGAVEEIKTDLKHCFDVVNFVDKAADRRIGNLEKNYNVLQRRLNRSNIIIVGLPRGIKDLRQHILKICSLCNVKVTDADIQHCTYFAGGKKILVKFNSVQTRDSLMISYHKNRNLKLKDIIGGTSESNVYLNDHLTDSAKKLVMVCRKLREENKILKYTFQNYDVPKVVVKMPDNNEKTFTYEQCVELLDAGGDCSFSLTATSGPELV